MDYKYIQQLLDRYWQGDTSIEEENILRQFFIQPNVPDELRQYRALFVYEHDEPGTDTLGTDFDERMMSLIDEGQPTVKARRITLRQRLIPLYKAAAVVAIVLTLGNAAQFSFDNRQQYEQTWQGVRQTDGGSVALSDSATIDTLHKSSMETTMPVERNILK